MRREVRAPDRSTLFRHRLASSCVSVGVATDHQNNRTKVVLTLLISPAAHASLAFLHQSESLASSCHRAGLNLLATCVSSLKSVRFSSAAIAVCAVLRARDSTGLHRCPTAARSSASSWSMCHCVERHAPCSRRNSAVSACRSYVGDENLCTFGHVALVE